MLLVFDSDAEFSWLGQHSISALQCDDVEGDVPSRYELGLDCLFETELLNIGESVAKSPTLEEEEEEDAESLAPVRRNRLCFWVSSFALCIGMSHSVQSIALSSWQNRMARFSY